MKIKPLKVMVFLGTSLFFTLLFTVKVVAENLIAKSDQPEKITVILQKQKDPSRLKSEAERLANALGDKLKVKATSSVPLDYSAPVQALISKTADVAYLDSVNYLLAARDGGAEILLVEQRPDSNGQIRTDYDSVFVVAKDSQIKDFKDMLTRAKDLRIAFTSPTSTSGYLFPYKRLVEEGLIKSGQQVDTAFRRVSFAGSYAQALQEVASGRADVCAVSNYAIEGHAAITYLPEKELNKLKILERNPGVPTHVIAVRAGLSTDFKERLKESLLDISKENPEIFSDVYGTASFTEVDGKLHTAATTKALELLNIAGGRS
jgi:phosphonate transport system substrate-binding protein